jgi:hypothetical protein
MTMPDIATASSLESPMSFQQKRALVSLIVIWIAAVGYAARVWRSPPDSLTQAAAMLVAAAIGLTVMMVIAHVLLIIGAGRDEARPPADERGRAARDAARRHAAWTMAGGLCLVAGVSLTRVSPAVLVQVAAAALVAAQMVRYGSELFHHRPAKGPAALRQAS